MNKRRLLGMTGACALAVALSNSTQAAPFTIDDFNVDTASSVLDTTVDGSAVSSASVIDGSNIVMNGVAGWTRTLTADLTAGHGIQTVVCNNCLTGHVNMTSGSSNGIGAYIYSGAAVDLSSFSFLAFDWGADLAGASVDIILSDGVNTSAVASWSTLAATGGSGTLVSQATMGIAWGAVNSTAITEIQFVVNGVANMDSSIDNFTAVVPIPPAAWFFGPALLSLAFFKRRQT